MSRNIEDYTFDLAESIVEDYSLELVDVGYQKEGENWILRVLIDKPGGVELEDCQGVSRELGTQLDVEDPIDKSYILEVSSPGLDRPLKNDEDFARFTGDLIDVSTYAPVEGEKKFTGELLGMIEDKVKVKIDDSKVVEIPKNKIAKANLAIDF
jgi:ribosome maturation factor RimP